MDKSLTVTSPDDFEEKIPDVEVFGIPCLFQLMSKASSKAQGWMKSTKVCPVPNGCLVQVTTQQGDHVADALTFVPGVTVEKDGAGRLVFVSSRPIPDSTLDFVDMGGSCLPIALLDEDHNFVERTTVDSISGGADYVRGWPRELSLLRDRKGAVTRAKYRLVD